MADGIKVPPGSGSDPTADTDEVTRNGQTVHQQIVKIGLGPDGVSDGLVSDANPLPMASAKAGTTTPATVHMTSGSSAQIVAANANRLGLIIFNPRAVDLLINLGTAASVAAAVKRLAPRQEWVLPILYTGAINGILAAGDDGNIYVQELTA